MEVGLVMGGAMTTYIGPKCRPRPTQWKSREWYTEPQEKFGAFGVRLESKAYPKSGLAQLDWNIDGSLLLARYGDLSI